jgi:hypothetical protein
MQSNPGERGLESASMSKGQFSPVIILTIMIKDEETV